MDTLPAITLYPEQLAAKDKFLNWFEDQDTPIFRIFGYAGVGKTTILRDILKSIDNPICAGAFSGKAALVMRRNGIDAFTIHSLIYNPITPSKKRAEEIKKILDDEKDKDKKGRKGQK